MWNISPLSNPQLVVAIGLSTLLILVSITVGEVAEILQMSPLTGAEWEEIFLMSLLPLVGVELTRVPLRRAMR